MRLVGGFLGTTLGRRLFTRFLFAAFVPASATAALAYLYVTAQLRNDIEARVGRSAKLAGLNTLATLEQFEEAFRAAVRMRAQRLPGAFAAGAEKSRFAGIEYRHIGEGVPSSSSAGGRQLTADEKAHLATGKTLLTVEGLGRSSAVYMAALDSGAVGGGQVVWTPVSGSSLWGAIAETLREEGTELCIIESRQSHRLQCDALPPDDALRNLGDIRGGGRVALASWRDGDTPVHAASWSIFLRYAYGAPDWRVIVSESSDAVFASLRRFTSTFAAISLAALLIVFFLSHSQIRKSTQPLEQLRAGTLRLEAGDFETLVVVNSGDEFDDLAASFNRMAQTLDRQIVTLRGLDALHQAVLGARELRPLLDTALARIAAVAPEAGMLVGVEQASNVGMEAVFRSGGQSETAVEVSFTDADRHELASHAGPLTLPSGTTRTYLTALLIGAGQRTVHVFTLLAESRVIGFIAVAAAPSKPLATDQLDAIRRLADRLALAVADVRHVSHLAALSSGTLTAFARAIDANSPWTAGHSERVTAYSLAIGDRLGLSTEDMETLRCGGLLHDIGKIGVPPQILDKAAPLTEAERAIIERHPTLGAEILAPIGAFTKAIPIVRSHHERMNGAGYPDRLAGDAIPFLARLLAVADVFDALVSDRPYRSGLAVSNAVDIITRETGTHFDPRPVAAFLEAVRAGVMDPIMATQLSSAKLANSVVAGRRVMEDAA